VEGGSEVAAPGGLYAGVIFHLWQKLPDNNTIWHVCVLAASAGHFAAVCDAVVLS
jgi:hemolysin III